MGIRISRNYIYIYIHKFNPNSLRSQSARLLLDLRGKNSLLQNVVFLLYTSLQLCEHAWPESHNSLGSGYGTSAARGGWGDDGGNKLCEIMGVLKHLACIMLPCSLLIYVACTRKQVGALFTQGF